MAIVGELNTCEGESGLIYDFNVEFIQNFGVGEEATRFMSPSPHKGDFLNY